MPRNKDHILVIKLGALGDFVQALGPMQAIRRHHPDSTLTLLTTKPYIDIAEKSGLFQDILMDTRPAWMDIKGWIHLRKKLNDGHYTRVYDLQNNDRTSFYFRLMSPRPEWVGVAPGASHRNISPERTAGLAFDGHVQTLSLAGIHDVAVDTLSWMKSDTSTFAIKTPYLLLIPGSAPSRPEKRWPAAHYAALCRMALDRGVEPVLIGTDSEIPLLKEISNTHPDILNLGGQTQITDIPALARGALAAIGNDTGPMHLIGPTGCKTIVLFSPASDPRRHAPLGKNVITVQKNNLKEISAKDVWAELKI